MAMKISKGEIANALTSIAPNHIIAVAADVYDETQDKYQNVLNEDFDSRIEALESSGGGGGSLTEGSVTEDKIAENAVTTDKIADGVVTVDKLSDEVRNMLNSGGGGDTPSFSGSASDVTYINTSSGLEATDVQGAIDELKKDIPTSVTEFKDAINYALKNDVPNNVSDLDDADEYAKKDDIPTESTVEDWGFTKGAYIKPDGGIPSEDLSGSVQASLSKADNALQPEALSDYAKSADVENVEGRITTVESDLATVKTDLAAFRKDVYEALYIAIHGEKPTEYPTEEE